MTFVRPFNIGDVRVLSSVVAGNCSLYGDLNELNKTELKVGLTSETTMNDFNLEELKTWLKETAVLLNFFLYPNAFFGLEERGKWKKGIYLNSQLTYRIDGQRVGRTMIMEAGVSMIFIQWACEYPKYKLWVAAAGIVEATATASLRSQVDGELAYMQHFFVLSRVCSL